MSQTTKRALEASLKKLLLQKPLNKITINDITEDCGVNRMTFYYHFKDIYDLVDWILVEDASKILEGRQSFETWNEAFLDILQRLQENKTLVPVSYTHLGAGLLPAGQGDAPGQLLLGQSIVADRLRTAQVEQDAQPQDQAHQQGREQKIAGCFVPHKHTFLRNTSMNLAKSGCQGIVNKVY